jgi:hypothetical protein
MARQAPRVGGRARVVAFGAIGRARARLSAGVTWTSRTASAGWAVRVRHTSVVDAAGAIYVVGGVGGSTGSDLSDVWASTDGGPRPDSVGGGGRGGTQGSYSREYSREYSRGAEGVLRGY